MNATSNPRSNLEGYPNLWTAIITPLNEKGDIDFEDFLKLLKLQESAKCGVVILGSTGEGLNLSQKEKESIVQFTSDQNLSVPVLVGVGGFLLDSCLDWMSFCQKKNIQGFLVPTPLYAKPGPEGQYRWFKTLLDHSSLPCMLYNVPSRAGTTLRREALEKLKDHKNFWSLKEASGSVEEFKAYNDLLPGQKIFSGDDVLTPDFAKVGCAGLVSVAANIWPKKTQQFLNQCLDGSLTSESRNLWETAGNSLFTSPNPIPTKWILKELGIIKSSSLKPPLTIEEVKNEGQLRETISMMESWD